jgi:hypothetical protein
VAGPSGGGQRRVDLNRKEAAIRRRQLIAIGMQNIQDAITDGTMRQRAADLGARIRGEDGVARAVAVVQDLATGAARLRAADTP